MSINRSNERVLFLQVLSRSEKFKFCFCPGLIRDRPVLVRGSLIRNQTKKNPSQASIQHLILIDREVDYITPLLTQQVYTGNNSKA